MTGFGARAISRGTLLRLFFLITVMTSVSAALAAHPHMWIQSELSPVLGPGGLEAVDVRWVFDEFNSATLIEGFDENLDGILDERETETARQRTFAHLIAEEYYLIVDVGGLLGTPMEARDFTAEIADGRVAYSFRVPLEVPIRWEDLDGTGLFLFDSTYFIDFRCGNAEDTASAWGNRTVAFAATRRELATRGYGKVSVAGLTANCGGPGAGDRTDGDAGSRRAGRVSLSARFKDWSFAMQERLASYTRRVVDDKDAGAFWTAAALALLFGLVHVLGPGHGKSFTLAYFSSRRARLGEGLALSVLINVLDSLSALLLVGVTYGILSLTIQVTGAAAGRITRIIAYSAVIVLGLGNLAAGFLEKTRGSTAPGDRRGRKLKPWMLALTVGLVPCPVSSVLLAYGFAEGALWFSLILVAAVSIGGMIALSAFSFAVIGGKAVLSRALRSGGLEKGLEWFEVLSMGALAVFGAILLIGAL